MTQYHEYFADTKAQHEKINTLNREEKRRFKIAHDIECDIEICERFKLFLTDITPIHFNQNVLVVSHGGIMKALLIEFDYGGYEEITKGWFNNLGFIKLAGDGKAFSVEEVKGFEADRLN